MTHYVGLDVLRTQVNQPTPSCGMLQSACRQGQLETQIVIPTTCPERDAPPGTLRQPTWL
jgi:hypothetical protein